MNFITKILNFINLYYKTLLIWCLIIIICVLLLIRLNFSNYFSHYFTHYLKFQQIENYDTNNVNDTNNPNFNTAEYLTECINNNIPVSFSKYGDGEYICAFNISEGGNCDNDSYTPKLRESLINSFKYMINVSNNAHIGLWHDYSFKKKWEALVDKPVKWVEYYSIIFNENNNKVNNINDKVILYKTIKQSKLNKIIVCNELLNKSKILFDANHIVNIPFNNWFDNDFESILENIKSLIGTDGNHIVMTCCGMSAKVLICELIKVYPKGIYLDFGSALDLICTKKDTRGYSYNYDSVKNLLQDTISESWDDTKYDNIYIEANKKLGLHM